MWETVELRELEIFLVLADELHFGRTAERLYISQSRVSQAVKTLESRVGGPLFERTSRHVRLTALGESMRAEVAPAYDQLRGAFQRARERATGITGTLRVGIYTPLNAGPHITAIVRAFNARHPACDFTFVHTGLDENPLSWLRTGRVDVLATRLPVDQPDITVGPVLSREPRVLLVSRDDPLAGRAAIDYDEIGDRPVSDLPNFPRELMDAYIPPVTASGRRLRRVVSRTTEEAMMRVAVGGQVHPTVSGWLDHHPHPQVVAIPIRDLPPSETGLAWLTAVRSPRVQAFAAAAAEVLAGHPGLQPGPAASNREP
jgi:DNA-binding transcriptional LysR family regulator